MTSFWSQFWASFWAQLVATGVLTFIVFEVYKKMFTPVITLRAKQNGKYSKIITAEMQDDGSYIATFRVAIKNKSSRTFLSRDGGYWHIAIPDDNVSIVHATCNDFDEDAKTFTSQIDKPAMPRSFADTECKITLRITNSGEHKSHFIYWHLTTARGYYPRRVRVDDDTGRVEYKTMGKMTIEIPN